VPCVSGLSLVHRYFRSWFHCFDAAVILVGFVVDVVLHGVVEEVASLVVILRLWRIFKIVEEFSVGAEEEMDALTERIEQLENENRELKKELDALKGRRTEGGGRV
jgi:voltage-gated hydrogen channel 1